MSRIFNYDILSLIKERWSTRAFSDETIASEEINAIFEAARYAPSCFNEQPWRFIIAYKKDELSILQSCLFEKNFEWAKHAPVLFLIISSTEFAYNKKANNYNQFDAGTAWGFLQLEAWNRGYATHAMAGFDKDKARELLNIPENFDILAMVALGKPKESDSEPNTRNSLDSIILDINSFK